MKGATKADWTWLLRFRELKTHVRVYDPETKCSWIPTAEDTAVPWPVIWLLARYNKKHIFVSRQLPSDRAVLKDVEAFENTIKLQWVHRKHPMGCTGFTVKPYVKAKCPDDASMKACGLLGWLRGFRQHIMDSVGRARRIATMQRRTANKQYCSNMLPLVKWGLQLLKKEKVVAIPTDKDGGFAVTRARWLPAIHLEILNGASYVRVRKAEIDIVRMKQEYRQITKGIGQLEEDASLPARLNCTLWGGNYTSRLQLTVKTHKAQHAQKCRNIHASPMYAFNGLSKWIALQFRRHLDVLPHRLTDASQLVSELKRLRPEAEFKFVKADIKDFFMSGASADLCSDAVSIFPESQTKDVVAKALLWLLQNQLLESDHYPDDCWHVIEGSGMGLIHSAEVAESAFYMRVEAKFGTRPVIMQKYGIVRYWRYRDDILMISRDRRMLVPYVRTIRRFSGYFIIDDVEISRHRMTFLQLLITKCDNEFTCCVTFKPTSLGVPLDTTSGHPASVHRWPMTYLRSIGKLSTTKKDCVESCERLLNRFRHHQSNPFIIQKMEACLEERSREKLIIRKVDLADAKRQAWFVCGYHPVLRRAIPVAVSKFQNDERWKYLIAVAFEKQERVPLIRLAWKNSLRNLMQRMQRHTRDMVGWMGTDGG